MFSQDLARFGPDATPPPLTLGESRRYCRRLARRHYENFTVASRLLAPPPAAACLQYLRLLPLGRRPGRRNRRSATQPRRCWIGGRSSSGSATRARRRIPVFIALAETIRQFDIPVEPLLRSAGRLPPGPAGYAATRRSSNCSDTAATRPTRWGGWCFTWGSATRRSGRRLADSICTGLQLANFWQDVARDWDRGRVYLPQADCRRFGYDEASFARRECNDAFRRLLAAASIDAEGRLRAGCRWRWRCPAGCDCRWHCSRRAGWLRWRRSAGSDYDVWTRRPTVSRAEKLRLLLGCWWKLRFDARGVSGR